MPGRGKSATRGRAATRGTRRPASNMAGASPKRARGDTEVAREAAQDDDSEGFQTVHVDSTERERIPMFQMDTQQQGTVLDFELPVNMSPGFTDTTGVRLSMADKQKIWAGKYVNLHGMLPKAGPQPRKTEVVLEEGKLVSISENKQVKTIKEWSAAFVNYILTYCEWHKDKYRELLVYFKLIQFAADNFEGFGWRTYDELFRAEMNDHPTKSWTIVDNNLWAVHVTKNPGPYHVVENKWGKGSQGSKRGSGNFKSKGQSNKRGTEYSAPRQGGDNCSFFNKGNCRYPPDKCRKPHKCNKCSGLHAETNCKK